MGGKEVFHGNKEVVELINSVQFDWDKIVETLIDFLNNGAGNMLSSTLTAAKSIISGVSTFVIAFLFAIYILLQKKKLGIQAKKVLFAFVRRGRAEAMVEVSSLTYSTFSSFLTGQCLEAVILGSMFVLAMTIFRQLRSNTILQAACALIQTNAESIITDMILNTVLTIVT